MVAERKLSKRVTVVVSFMSIFVIFVRATTINIPRENIPDSLVRKALNSLNEISPTGNTYRNAEVINAQKLLDDRDVIYRLTLSLEPNCNIDEASSSSASCSREACSINLHERDSGAADVHRESVRCVRLDPRDKGDPSDSQQTVAQPITSGATVPPTEKESSSIRLDHEVQTIGDANERPFIAVRATDRSYCAGCPYDLDPRLPGVAAYGERVVQSMDETGRSPFKHRVVEIIRVTRAVPPGSNVVVYELTLKIGETRCQRIGVSPRSDCNIWAGAPILLCVVAFEQRPWQHENAKIVRNNCTDDAEIEDESTSAIVRRNASMNDGAAVLSSVGKEKFAAYANYIDEFFDGTSAAARTTVPNSDPSPVTETAEKKIWIGDDETRKGEIADNSMTFSDKYKEFEKFLEDTDFNAALKSRDSPVGDHPTPVDEAPMRREYVAGSRYEDEASASGRAKRSTREETELVRKLAQKTVDELNSIDGDERKRVLLDVLNSRKRSNENTIYSITMRVAKNGGNCSEETSSEETVDCTEGREGGAPVIKICKSQVQTNKEGSYETAKVLQSLCFEETTPRKRAGRSRRQLLGSPVQKPVDDPEIREFANKALKKFSEIRGVENEPYLVEIIEATAQIVSGTKYRIRAKLGESTCSKGERENCRLKSDSRVDEYLLIVWSQPWKDKGEPEVRIESMNEKKVTRAKRESDGVPGGVGPISPDDPEIRKYAEKAIDRYSHMLGGESEPYLVEIVESTKQVVSGMLYKIRAKVGESTCPKGVKENCALKSNGSTQEYVITVWSQPWIDHGDPDIKIESYKEKKKRLAKRHLRGQNYSPKMLKIAKTIENERAFEKFLNVYGKKYASEEERNYRFRVFEENMRRVENLRYNEQGTATYGATIFADLTPEEFRTRRLGLKPELRTGNELPLPTAEIPDIELPREFDWRRRNVVTEVKDQGSCGSCWAFSVTGNVEGLYAIKHGKLLSFSEQELVDCDKLDSGCAGGLPDTAYRAIEQIGGLEVEKDYPYDGEKEVCHFDKSKVRASVLSGLNITSNETRMAQWLVQNGPISVGINANAMQFYMGGISHPFKFLCNADNLDHGVLIVGYGVHTYPIFKKNMPYWIIKNSWGPRWGEQGYYRIYRGDGTCGVNKMATSAVVA